MKTFVVAKYIRDEYKEKNGFCTSAGVYEVLHKHVEEILKEAVANTISERRKTVMDRDIIRAIDKIAQRSREIAKIIDNSPES